mgnify:CR=1 FL=1
MQRVFDIDKAAADSYHFYRTPSTRAIDEIPTEEIMNVVTEVLDEEFSLPRDRVAAVVARKLGFAVTGPKISAVVKDVVGMMEQLALATIRGDQLTVADK